MICGQMFLDMCRQCNVHEIRDALDEFPDVVYIYGIWTDSRKRDHPDIPKGCVERALSFMIHSGHPAALVCISVVVRAITRHPNISIQDCRWLLTNAIRWAIIAGSFHTVSVLIDISKNVNVQVDGPSLLYTAALAKNVATSNGQIVLTMIEKLSINPNIPPAMDIGQLASLSGQLPPTSTLAVACVHGNLPVVETLLLCGASPTHRDLTGWTAIDWVQKTAPFYDVEGAFQHSDWNKGRREKCVKYVQSVIAHKKQFINVMEELIATVWHPTRLQRRGYFENADEDTM